MMLIAIVIVVLLAGFSFGLAAGWWITRPRPKPEPMSPERRYRIQNRGLGEQGSEPGPMDVEYVTWLRNTRDPHENDPLW